MGEIDVAFIGAGNRAQAHYRSVEHIDGANVIATCDLDDDRREQTAEEYGIPHTFADYEVMLDELDVDAVYIIMFPELYDPIVTDLLQQGINVFVEKPPGVHSQQTHEWADLADEHGCKTCVGYQRRFHPLAREAKLRVTERSEVNHAVGTFHKANLDKELHNDLLWDVSHVIDLLAWAGGGVTSVDGYVKQAFAEPSSYDLLDANMFLGVFELESGGLGLLNSNRTAGGRSLTFEMHGLGISAYGDIHGDVSVDRCVFQTEDVPISEAEVIQTTDVIDESLPSTAHDGTYQLNNHFIECIRDDLTPGPAFNSTVDTMESVEEILCGKRMDTTLR